MVLEFPGAVVDPEQMLYESKSMKVRSPVSDPHQFVVYSPITYA